MFPTVKWLFFDVGSTLVDEQLCYVLRLQEIASLANLPYELIWETAMQFYRQNQKGDARAAERFGVKMPAWHTESSPISRRGPANGCTATAFCNSLT